LRNIENNSDKYIKIQKKKYGTKQKAYVEFWSQTLKCKCPSQIRTPSKVHKAQEIIISGFLNEVVCMALNGQR